MYHNFRLFRSDLTTAFSSAVMITISKVKFGAKISGCTVHLADNQYDHGPIIVQKAVPVLQHDSADDLAARVFEAEKEALPEAIQLFADERIQVRGRIVKIREPAEVTYDAP